MGIKSCHAVCLKCFGFLKSMFRISHFGYHFRYPKNFRICYNASCNFFCTYRWFCWSGSHIVRTIVVVHREVLGVEALFHRVRLILNKCHVQFASVWHINQCITNVNFDGIPTTLYSFIITFCNIVIFELNIIDFFICTLRSHFKYLLQVNYYHSIFVKQRLLDLQMMKKICNGVMKITLVL